MALVTSSETKVEPLIIKTMQRLLYHTAFPCGLFLSDIKNNGDTADVYVEEVIGGGLLSSHKSKRLILPKELLYGESALFSIIEDIFGQNIKYKTALRLPVSDTERFILLSVSPPKSQLPFNRIFEPVLKNFGKTLSLSRENERHTMLLEDEITRRAELEISLRESEIRHRTIFESTVDGIINIDTKGIIESINPAIEKIFGYTSAELIGNNVSMLMPESFANQHDLFISKFRQTGETTVLGLSRELFALRKDNTVFPVDIALDEMLINDKRMFTGIIRDVTDRKEAEQNIIKVKEEAERANHAKSEFLSSMSHELRTPLNAILGFSQLVQLKKELPIDTKECVDEIFKAGHHLLKLINEVLNLASIEAGHVDLSFEAIKYDEIILECISLVEPIAAHNEVQIFNSQSIEKIAFRGDKTRIKQVIVNLLSNAIKYNRRGGQVNVSVSLSNEDFYRISIKDTGTGIKEENISGLFEAFNRLDAANTDIEGTGIGLVITKRLVELMGGKIGFESEYGVGSTFWIEMPKDITSATEVNTINLENRPVQIISGSNEYSVLYIEDNPSNLKLVIELLATKPYLNLFTAHTPRLGLELAEIKLPDLILLDINLPEMDGYGVLEKLRKNTKTSSIPVIAISANAMPNDFIKAEKAGFNDYLTKPLDINNFYKTIEQILVKE